MKDLMHNVLKAIDHNRYTVAAIVVFIVTMGMAINLTGCQATTPALIDTQDGTAAKVTRSEFARQVIVGQKDFTVRRIELEAQTAAFNEEVQAFNERIAAGQEDLLRQEQFKQQLLDTVGLIAASAAEGTFNPGALIPIGIGLLGGALGLGTAADNRRKDQVITTLKTTPVVTG